MVDFNSALISNIKLTVVEYMNPATFWGIKSQFEIILTFEAILDEKKNLMVIWASFGFSKEKPCEIEN